MPAFTGHMLGVFIGVNHQDFGMAVGRRRTRVDVEVAEFAAQRLMLVDGHRLIAEEQHLMFHQGVVQFLKLLVAKRLAQIDAVDLSTDIGGAGAHGDALI